MSNWSQMNSERVKTTIWDFIQLSSFCVYVVEMKTKPLDKYFIRTRMKFYLYLNNHLHRYNKYWRKQTPKSSFRSWWLYGHHLFGSNGSYLAFTLASNRSSTLIFDVSDIYQWFQWQQLTTFKLRICDQRSSVPLVSVRTVQLACCTNLPKKLV